MVRRNLLLALVLLLVVGSCRFKPKDGLNWEQNLVAPLVKSRLSLKDALNDTTNIREASDNSLSVVYRDTLADLPLDEYLVIPDTSVGNKITLDSLSLATDTLEQDITMFDIGTQLDEQGNVLGTIILSNDGQTVFFPVNESGLNSDTTEIDASQFFDEADLISGKLVFEIENNTPFNLSNVDFVLTNNGVLNTVLAQKTIPLIPAYQTRSDSSDLSGLTVESQLAGQLANLDIQNAFSSWTINHQDYIRLRIIVKDLGASRATAVFPAQRVLDDSSRVRYDFGEDEIEITRFQVESGQLRIRAFSTIQDTIVFDYRLPTALRNGQPVRVSERLIPDTVADTAGANIVFDLEDYYIDLTVNGDSVNLFPYILTGDLLESGVKQTMDLSDSIDVFYGLFQIKPSYIEGYLGKQDLSFKDSIQLDFFNAILGGSVSLEDPKVGLTIYNSIGVDGEFQINKFTAYNAGGEIRSLSGPITTTPIEVLGPRLPNVGQTLVTQVELNQGNSNIRDIISMLPNRIDFDLNVAVNKNGNPELRDNFATNTSRITALLDMEVPLHGTANGLTLQDTVPVNITEANLPDGVTDGTLKLVLANQFPFDAQIQIYFQDVGGNAFDSLFTDGPSLVPAGVVDQNGVVMTPTESTLAASFDQNRLDNLRILGSQAIIRFTLDTKPNGIPVKLYSTYGIDMTLVGDFRYNLGL